MTTVVSTYTNRSRAKRVAAGLCGFCGKPRDRWKFLCNFCQEKHRLRQRKPASTRADAAHEPPTPEPVFRAPPHRPPTRPVKVGPEPRSTFNVGQYVSWVIVLPGIGTEFAKRVTLSGPVIAIDTSQMRPAYIVKHLSSGAEFRRPVTDLLLATHGMESTDGDLNRLP